MTLYNELARGSVEQLDSQLRTYKRYFHDTGQCVYEEHRRNGRPPLKLSRCTSSSYTQKSKCWRKSLHLTRFAVKCRPSGCGHPQHKRLYGMSIEQRPERVNRCEEFDHWEIDTVVGNTESSAVLLTLNERTTRYRHILKITSRSAQAVAQDLAQLRALYGERFSSVFVRLPATTAASLPPCPSSCRKRRATMRIRIRPASTV